MKRRPILATVLSVGSALLLAGALAGTAAAASPGLDPAFGNGGIVRLDSLLPRGVKALGEGGSQPAPDGSTYGLARAKRCAGRCSEYLFHFRPSGRLDRSFGYRGLVRLPDHETGSRYALGIDAQGRPVVTQGKHGAKVLRFTKAGRPDRSFGHDGKVWLPKMERNPATVQPLPGGGLLLSSEDIDGTGGFALIRLAELHENGRPMRTFSDDGFVAVGAPGTFHLPPAPTRHGSVLIAAEGCCTELVSVVRVSKRGRLDRRFNREARRSLAPLDRMESEHFLAELDAYDLVARSDGGADLFGNFGNHGFEVRIAGDGRPVAGFGRRGIRRSARPVNFALPLRGGGFFAFGEGYFGPLRAFVLGPGGSPDRRFPAIPISPWSVAMAATETASDMIQVTFDRRREVGEPDVAYAARFVLPHGLVSR